MLARYPFDRGCGMISNLCSLAMVPAFMFALLAIGAPFVGMVERWERGRR
jgi:hypothetical protein